MLHVEGQLFVYAKLEAGAPCLFMGPRSFLLHNAGRQLNGSLKLTRFLDEGYQHSKRNPDFAPSDSLHTATRAVLVLVICTSGPLCRIVVQLAARSLPYGVDDIDRKVCVPLKAHLIGLCIFLALRVHNLPRRNPAH